MKKIILTTFFVLFSFNANAINLGKIVEDAGKSQVDNIAGKAEERVNKVFDRLEKRVEKYEKKFDDIEQKIEKAEKATDRVINTLNSFDQSKIQQYVTYAKYAAIAFTILVILSFSLLVLIFVQSMRINAALKRMQKNA